MERRRGEIPTGGKKNVFITFNAIRPVFIVQWEIEHIRVYNVACTRVVYASLCRRGDRRRLTVKFRGYVPPPGTLWDCMPNTEFFVVNKLSKRIHNIIHTCV